MNELSRSLVKVNGLISNVTSCIPNAVVVDITNCSITWPTANEPNAVVAAIDGISKARDTSAVPNATVEGIVSSSPNGSGSEIKSRPTVESISNTVAKSISF